MINVSDHLIYARAKPCDESFDHPPASPTIVTMAFANSDLLSYGDYGESADDGYDSDEARAQRMKTNVPSTRPWRAEMQKLIDQGIDVWELEVCLVSL